MLFKPVWILIVPNCLTGDAGVRMKYLVSLRWVIGSNKSELSSGVGLGYLPWNQTYGCVEFLRKSVKVIALIV